MIGPCKKFATFFLHATNLEMFMYVPMAANTSQTLEGTVGSSITVSVLNTTATIGRLAFA